MGEKDILDGNIISQAELDRSNLPRKEGKSSNIAL